MAFEVKNIVKFKEPKDRIEMTYQAIDEIVEAHGKKRPVQFGGGKWNAREEFKIYKKQIGERYTPLQWHIIESYFNHKIKEKKNV